MGQLLPFVAAENAVVIVDDDVAVRDALSLLLRVDGFSTLTFGDGDSFLDALPGLAPTCVILDLHMPGSSGLTVLSRLTDLKFAAPVFVISGQSDIAMAVEAMKLGARDFLEKPFSASAMCWRRSHTAPRTRKRAAGSASARAPSRCIARASWTSSAPGMPPI